MVPSGGEIREAVGLKSSLSPSYCRAIMAACSRRSVVGLGAFPCRGSRPWTPGADLERRLRRVAAQRLYRW